VRLGGQNTWGLSHFKATGIHHTPINLGMEATVGIGNPHDLRTHFNVYVFPSLTSNPTHFVATQIAYEY